MRPKAKAWQASEARKGGWFQVSRSRIRDVLGAALSLVAGILGYHYAMHMVAADMRGQTIYLSILVGLLVAVPMALLAHWLWRTIFRNGCDTECMSAEEHANVSLAEEAMGDEKAGRKAEASEKMARAVKDSASLHVLDIAVAFYLNRSDLTTVDCLLERWLSICGPEAQTKHAALAQLYRGLVFLEREKWVDAELAVKDALLICERIKWLQPVSEIQTQLGRAYIGQNRLEEAEEAIRNAISMNQDEKHDDTRIRELATLSSLLLKEGDLRGAEHSLQQAIFLCERMGFLVGLSSYLRAMASILWRKKEFSKAERVIRKAIEADSRESLPGDLERDYCFLGYLLEHRRDFPGAVDAYQVALRGGECAGNMEVILESCVRLASLRIVLGEYADAQQLILTSQKACGQMPQCNLQVYALLVQSELDEIMGRLLDAALNGAKAVTYASSLGTEEEMAQAMTREAALTSLHGDYSKAADQCRKILGDRRYTKEISARTWSLLSCVLLQLGDLDGAESATREYLECAPGIEDGLVGMIHTELLGRIHLARGDIDEAEACFRKLLAGWEEVKSRGAAAAAEDLLSVALTEAGKGEEAERAAQRAITFARESGCKGQLGARLRNLAEAIESQDRMAEAEALQREALAIDEEIQRAPGIAWGKAGLARMCLARGEMDAAEQLAKEALAMHKEMNCGKGIADSLRDLGYIAEKKRDTSTACEFLTKAHEAYARMGMRLHARKTEERIAGISTRTPKPTQS